MTLRFLVRRIPRFSLPTLSASMLLFVSVVGAVRYGHGPEYQEKTALRALVDENIRFAAMYESGARGQGPEQLEIDWNPIRRLANWLVGNTDRIVTIRVYGSPSAETREALFALPRLKSLQLQPVPAPTPVGGPTRLPRLDEILGRPLPAAPSLTKVSADAPPLPQATPLSDEDRDAVVQAMAASWNSAPEFPGDRFLCSVESTDMTGVTLVTAVDADAAWRLIYSGLPNEAGASTELINDRDLAEQLREDGGWRTNRAVRDGGPYESRLHNFLPISSTYLDWSHSRLFVGQPESLYESAERLDDGGLLLLLRMRPRDLPANTANSGPCRLVKGALIVEPRFDFAIRRIETTIEGELKPGTTISICQTFEYATIDGHRVPTRSHSWIELPPAAVTGLRLGGKRTAQTVYGWDFDPELPSDIFEPTRGGAEFFTSTPTPRFHWWYVTGGLSLGWFYVIASRRIRRRLQSPRESQSAASSA